MDIYQKHDSAFNNVNAHVIATTNKQGGIERLATVAFIRGDSGNVRCFFHLIGVQMQLGQAGGGGYDKHSAAFYEAVKKAREALNGKESVDDVAYIKDADAILAAAVKGNGSSRWMDALRENGYFVLQAV